MKYTILFTKMLFISCLLMAMGISVTGCSDDDDELQSGYGYAQFRLYKSASYGNGESGKTRAGTNELEYLREAQKMKIVLINNEDGTEISQTVGLDAINDQDAEFGMRSEKMQMLAGEYTVVGFYLYKIEGQELVPVISGEPEKETVIRVVDGGLSLQDITVNAVERGSVKFTLVKDIANATRAAGDAAYLLENVKYVTIEVKDLYLTGKIIPPLKEIPVTYQEKGKEITTADGEKKTYIYSVSVSDSLLYLKAGTYKVSKYTLLDRNKKTIEVNVTNIKENQFVVKDNQTTEVEVPVYMRTNSPKLKDYKALKAIWDALDGEHWSYTGISHTVGCNWNFDKDMDLWGDQPGVELDTEGRVVSLNLGSFGPEGDIPDEIGDLEKLQVLTFGTHSDQVGGYLEKSLKAYMSVEEKKAVRADYYETFLRKDLKRDWKKMGFSEPLLQVIDKVNTEQKPNLRYPVQVTNSQILNRSGISLKDVSPGRLTNGIRKISAAIGKLTNLRQFFIANGKFEGFEEGTDLSKLESLTDVEIYNCPSMKEFPKEICRLPNLELLNLANNPQLESDVLLNGLKGLADEKSATAKTVQMLYLGNNNLTEIPKEFKNLKKLGKLDCNNNKIAKVHPLGKDVNLVQLTMDYNQITEVPNDFCGYEDVESFSFAHNKITKFPNIFNAKSVYVMSSVDFSYNEITEFAGENETGDNAFKGINASTLSLAYNKLKTFPGILFKTNSQISTLALAGNGITDFPKGALDGKYTNYLQSLDLSYNKLKKLPEDFDATKMPYLYGIDLSNNHFEKVATGPLNIDHLNVYAFRNQRDEQGNRTVSDWPSGISQCPSLLAVYLGGNDFRKVEESLTGFRIVEIKDNPNIMIDVSAACNYIKAGYLLLIYDRTQAIRGCDALDLE